MEENKLNSNAVARYNNPNDLIVSLKSPHIIES